MKNPSNTSDREVLYERIANQLEEMIVNDRSKIEKKLPSEQRLAESFSVSRPVIREALKILKARGLIESRQGASSVVVEYSPENVLKSLARFTQTKNVRPEQIHQVRTAIELLAVRVACEHVSEHDIQTLKALNENLKNSDNKTEQAMFDITLHKTIVQLTQNPLLEAIYNSLIDLIKPVIEKSTTKETVQDGVFWHSKIIDTLAQGDGERATALMQEHLLLSIRNFEYYNL